MTPTKLLIGQILVVFAIVLAGIWFSTQWAAARHRPRSSTCAKPLAAPWQVLAKIDQDGAGSAAAGWPNIGRPEEGWALAWIGSKLSRNSSR